MGLGRFTLIATMAAPTRMFAWSAQGKSAWEIGEILTVSKRTVDEHAQTAMRKLGAARHPGRGNRDTPPAVRYLKSTVAVTNSSIVRETTV
jgi:Bacterial regulatory proteins, luxR family